METCTAVPYCVKECMKGMVQLTDKTTQKDWDDTTMNMADPKHATPFDPVRFKSFGRFPNPYTFDPKLYSPPEESRKSELLKGWPYGHYSDHSYELHPTGCRANKRLQSVHGAQYGGTSACSAQFQCNLAWDICRKTCQVEVINGKRMITDRDVLSGMNLAKYGAGFGYQRSAKQEQEWHISALKSPDKDKGKIPGGKNHARGAQVPSNALSPNDANHTEWNNLPDKFTATSDKAGIFWMAKSGHSYTRLKEHRILMQYSTVKSQACTPNANGQSCSAVKNYAPVKAWCCNHGICMAFLALCRQDPGAYRRR